MSTTENLDKAPNASSKKLQEKVHSNRGQAAQGSKEPGAASWKANEQHVVPHNNIPLVFFSLLLTTFLVCNGACVLRSVLIFCPPLRLHWIKQCVTCNGRERLYSHLLVSVATALPTIVSQIGGGNNYSWVGRCIKCASDRIF
jgi:hypothetical protein